MRHAKGKGRELSVPIGYVPGNLSKAVAEKIDSITLMELKLY
jgi:hypothetical protein